MSTEDSPVCHESEPKVIRLTRPSLVVLCGPAACGKSTFAAKHFRPTQIVSSDHARALVCDDERDQRYQAQAFALLHFLIEQRLSINRLCVVDSTALTAAARKNLIDIARRCHVPTVVLLLDIPLEICLERDAQRERTVGRAIIERQYELFREARAALPQEGFDQVIELGDAELGRVRFEIIFRPLPRPAQNNARPEARRFAPRPSRPPSVPAPAPHDARKPDVPNGRPPKPTA
jgi:protein phosphatase